MSRDNRHLGTITLSGIPPAPARTESVDVEFDIDANGILKVTATSTSGSNKSIAVTAEEEGELTRAEIEECITRAELMASLDQKEEMRVIARSNFYSYCLEMQLEHTTNENISKVIDNCLEWIRLNPGAPQKTYEDKLKELKKHITGSARGAPRYWEKFRERQLGVDESLEMAKKYFDSRSFHTAFEWFIRCYHIASVKKNEAVMRLAILHIGKSVRCYVESQSSSNFGDSSSREIFARNCKTFLLRGAQWLVFGLKSFQCSDGADDMIEELFNIKKVLFDNAASLKDSLESLECLSQLLILFHHFDFRCCGEKLRNLMGNSYRDFLNTATLYMEQKINSSINDSVVHQNNETLSHLQGLSEPGYWNIQLH